MSDVYVVTSGIYSDYDIEAIFKSREKAELYCKCHEYCEIEEWDFNDDSIYTVYDYVRVTATMPLYKNGCDVLCEYMKGAIEDNPYNRDKIYVLPCIDPILSRASQGVEIQICKELPKNYSPAQVDYKWERLIKDLAAEIRYEFADVDNVDSDIVTEFVKKELGILEERIDD